MVVSIKFLLAGVLSFALHHSASAVNLNVTNCVYHGHRATGVLNSVSIASIQSCDPTCLLQSNQSYTVTVDFHAEVGSAFTLTEVQAFQGLSHPVSLYKTQTDCQVSLHCPVLSGTDVTYLASFTAPDVATSQTMVAKWVIKGDGDRAIVCFEFPFVIRRQ